VGINRTDYKIAWEDLKPGPVGEYLEVIDHDPASNCYYEPVDLNDPGVLAGNGLHPSEGNPQFHQQFVYAVIMNTIGVFERALGRKIIWRARGNDYTKRIRIYPHAFRDANAYYDPEKRAILFGYFEAAGSVNGANFPNGLVFTCLSPDIIAHETTHALLDSIHPRFMEDTNPDVAAFHEGFADIVALLNRFSMTNVLEHELAKTSGRLDIFNIMGELATQFGEALDSHHGALRSAIGHFVYGKWERQKPNPGDYISLTEAHDKGALLVATIFDAFIKLYDYRTKDLIRIASNGTGVLPQGAISTDLTKRLAGEAADIAQHLLRICIRALDFCPPVDINFGDYLRALITADIQLNPEDDGGYRVSLIEAFRARGIFPDGLKTLSDESLVWNRPTFTPKANEVFKHLAGQIKNQVSLLADLKDREQIFHASRKVQAALQRMLTGKQNKFTNDQWESFLNEMGMTSKLRSIKYEGNNVVFKNTNPPIEVHKIRPIFKQDENGRIINQVLITLTQSSEIISSPLEGVKFRGGSTLVMNLDEELEIQYIICKNINGKVRFKNQMDYMSSGAGEQDTSLSMYDDDHLRPNRLNLSKLHSNH
jgi:hypothetical protein